MENVTVDTTVSAVLAIAAALVVLSGAAMALQKCASPFRRIDDLERRLDIGRAELDESANSNKIIIKALIVLLEHNETGNSTGAMRATRKELEDYLIER